MANTDLNLGNDATAANNLILRADGAGGGSICNGAGTALVKVPAGGVPAFRAYASGATSVGAVATRIDLGNDSTAGSSWDTGGCFNATSGTVTLNGISTPAYAFAPNVAGYYLITGHISFVSNTYAVLAYLYKNGVAWTNGTRETTGSQVTVTDLVYLDGVDDYVQLYGYSATSQNTDASVSTNFSGILIKAA